MSAETTSAGHFYLHVSDSFILVAW